MAAAHGLNNDCGKTTPYCAANEENCQAYGGHWVPKSIALSNYTPVEDELEAGEVEFEDKMLL